MIVTLKPMSLQSRSWPALGTHGVYEGWHFGVGRRLGDVGVDGQRRGLGHGGQGQVDAALARGPDAEVGGLRRRLGGGQLGGVDARHLVDVVDAVAAGDRLGRVERVADVDVGEEPVEPVALVLGRVELERDGWPSSVSFAKAVASGPKHDAGRLGSTVSGVSMPMIRTFSMPLGSWTWIVSPSTTSTTVPARSSGAAVGDGARVGESVGAIGDGETMASRGRAGVGGLGGGGRVRSRPAAGGDHEDDDGAGREQADLAARHSAVRSSQLMRTRSD